ncbi:MAG: hypothetical protein EOL95_10485 [Bacteroidia bacterium]|nr:hypothetical protein [Bacteroidia bacterium]
MSFNSQIKGNIDNFYTNTAKAGCTVTRTPVTKTFDETYGQETLTEGTSESIDVYMTRNYPNEFFIAEEGKVEKGDAFIMVKSTQTLNVDDVITYDNKKFRVKNKYRVLVNGVLCATQGNLFLIENL